MIFIYRTANTATDVNGQPSIRRWRNILGFTLKESLKTMIMRTSTFTLLIYAFLIMLISGNTKLLIVYYILLEAQNNKLEEFSELKGDE